MSETKTISKDETELLDRFRERMQELLNLNTHKGPIVVDDEECDYLYLHLKIAEHALALCEHASRLKKGQALGTLQTQNAKKACVDIANLAFIYKSNMDAGKR